MELLLGKNLKFLRKKIGLTQADVGLQVSKAANTIGYWESGNNEPNATELVILSQFFDVSLNDILFFDLSKGANLQKFNQQKETEKGANLGAKHGANHPKSAEISSAEGGDLPLFKTAEIELPLSNTKNNVFDLSSKAAAGFVGHLLSQKDKHRAEPDLYIPSLGPGLHIRVPITGDSMHTTIKDGDKAVATLVTEASSVRSGHVYILFDKEDGVVCKRVYWSDEETFELVSDNDFVKPYERRLSDILAIFRVREVHTRDLRPYNLDLRRDMIDIRSEIAVLRKHIGL